MVWLTTPRQPRRPIARMMPQCPGAVGCKRRLAREHSHRTAEPVLQRLESRRVARCFGLPELPR